MCPVLWSDRGLATLFKEGLKGKSLGRDLDLILIHLIVESDLSLRLDQKMRIGRYSKKEKSISVKIPMTRATLDCPDEQLRTLIIKLTLEGIDLVSDKLKGKVDTDFIAVKKALLELSSSANNTSGP